MTLPGPPMKTPATRVKILFGLMSALLIGGLGAIEPAAAQSYSVIKLPTLGGGSSHVAGVNNAGQVVGDSATREAVTHAFVFHHGTITDLGTLGGANSFAAGINSAGLVVGYSDMPFGTAQHATLWIGATPIDLGTNGGRFSVAYAINDAGEIVGSTSTAVLGPQAARWIALSIADIGSDPTAFSVARGINASGQIVGQQNDPEPLGYVWNGLVATQLLASLGDGESDAYAINSRGQVAGWAQVSSVPLAPNHAVRWSSTTATSATDLGTLGGTSSAALGMNAAGHIVGWAGTSSGAQHAAVWIGIRANDLNEAIGRAHSRYVVLTEATGINDHGWIVANGVDRRTNETKAYLLIPRSAVCRDRDRGRDRDHDAGDRPRQIDSDPSGGGAEFNASREAKKRAPTLGMTEAQVRWQTLWGAPRTVSTARIGDESFDLWWYDDERYLEFMNDCLAEIHK